MTEPGLMSKYSIHSGPRLALVVTFALVSACTSSGGGQKSAPAPQPDSQAPTVSLTSPIDGAAVAGSVAVGADASDNVGVVGVQFRLVGNALGAEDLTAPYSVSWTTTANANGAHELSATARDAAGHTAAATLPVTVSDGATGGTSLTVDGNLRFQTIDGFGVSAN